MKIHKLSFPRRHRKQSKYDEILLPLDSMALLPDEKIQVDFSEEGFNTKDYLGVRAILITRYKNYKIHIEQPYITMVPKKKVDF